MENKNSNLLAMSIVAAAIILGGALIYSAGLKNIPDGQANASDIIENNGNSILESPEIGDDVVLGESDAPVTVFVFGDYQCSYCAKFFKQTESLIRENYVDTGKVKMVYKDLAFLGPESFAAAQAAECAKDQKKYWQFHDALYEMQYEKLFNSGTGVLDRATFGKIASNFGMNSEEFLGCFDSKKYEAEVQGDIAEANRVMKEVSTPTIFVNETLVQGAQPYENFKNLIDAALSE